MKKSPPPLPKLPGVTCFMAAICRDLVEGGDGTRYFGSLLSFRGHWHDAQKAGLVAGSSATRRGHAVGIACRNLPEGRAYFHAREYERVAQEALDKFTEPSP